MPNNFPFENWYWNDWVAATAMLSPSARGIWVELLGVMFLDNRNYLVSGTVEELARAARCSVIEMVSAIKELDRQKVAEITVSDASVSELSPDCLQIVSVICRRRKKIFFERKRKTEEKKNLRRRQGVSDMSPSLARARIKPLTNNQKKDKKEVQEERNERFVANALSLVASGDGDDDAKKDFNQNQPQKIVRNGNGKAGGASLFAGLAQRVYNAYPKKYAMVEGMKAVVDAAEMLFDRGMSVEEIAGKFLGAVKLYAEAVRDYPARDRRYVFSAKTFFESGHYEDDPETWRQYKREGPECPEASRRCQNEKGEWMV